MSVSAGPFPWATQPPDLPGSGPPSEPPAATEPGKWPNLFFWAVLSAAIWLWQHQGPIVPPSTEPPGQPPVVVDPGAPVVLDDIGKLIRDAAVALPKQCHGDFGKVAENYRQAASLIDSNHIRTDVEVGGWLRIENRRDSTDEAAWTEFGRAQQKIWTGQKDAGKLLLLSDWARMLRSTADGIMAAQTAVSGPQPTPAGREA